MNEKSTSINSIHAANSLPQWLFGYLSRAITSSSASGMNHWIR